MAKYGDRYIGYSYFKKLNNEELQQGNTAVLKEYWNTGVATALKVRILQFGKDHGYRTIESGHRNNNIPMRIVNEQKLGFIPISSEIRLELATFGH
nr:GNAT family N-acetyltransferase [Paenibacillus ginsengarvi]